MNPDILVFYAGMLYGEYTHEEWELAHNTWASELYNGAYMYVINRCMRGRYGPRPGWYRLDGTPRGEDDIPKELLAYKLILT